MCGIAGIFGPFQVEKAHSIARDMARLLQHRGPDHQAVHVESPEKGIALGLSHTLLGIIGKPGEGVQPFKVPGGVLVFNGAIYNFQDLRRVLQSKGVQFVTGTDTEVLAHGLATEGLDFLNKVRGMFAFGFWDSEKKRLWIGRDPFGVKPLYYTKSKNGILFASEYKALVPHLDKCEFDNNSFSDYLRLRYVPGHGTLFKEIRKVAPGTVTEISDGGKLSKPVPFFNWEPARTPPSKEELRFLLKQAISRRAIADVEVAALLSGGIDSSLVCDVLQESVKSLHTYTLSFPGLDINEADPARILSTRIGATNTEIIDSAPTLETLAHLAYHLDDPYGDPIILALNQIFSFIKGHQRVIVTGEGSDELFSGYIHHRVLALLNRIPKPLMSIGGALQPVLPLSTMARIFPYSGKLSAADYQRAIHRFTHFLQGPSLLSYQSIFFLFDSDDLVHSQSTQLTSEEDPASLTALRKWDLQEWLPNSQLFKLDKISMASSIEAREPFVDQDLIKAILALKPKHHIKWKSDKPVLRRAISGHTRVPSNVIKGKKSSFFKPFQKSRNETLYKELKQVIHGHHAFLTDWVKDSVLDSLLSNTDEGLVAQKQVFALGMLALWKEQIAERGTHG